MSDETKVLLEAIGALTDKVERLVDLIEPVVDHYRAETQYKLRLEMARWQMQHDCTDIIRKILAEERSNA